MNARVIFSKEFLAKTKGNDMKQSTKSNLYFSNLQKLDESGELQRYTTRAEVAKAVGFLDKTKGYTWMANAIRRGRIKETLLYTENGKVHYEYHYGRDAQPRGEHFRKYQAMKKQEAIQRVVKAKEELFPPKPTASPVLTIKYGKVEITVVENTPIDFVVELVKQLGNE